LYAQGEGLNKASANGYTSSFDSQRNFTNGSNIMITRLDVNAVTADGTFLQGELTAGENITISGDVISATGGGSSTSKVAIKARRTTQTRLNTSIIVPWSDVDFNIGAGYDSTTYKFTVPIKGIYYFEANILRDYVNNNNNSFAMNIMRTKVTGGTQMIGRLENIGVQQHHTALIFELEVGDQVYTQRANGTFLIQGDTNFFSGYLIMET
jgi:hypothetical protein